MNKFLIALGVLVVLIVIGSGVHIGCSDSQSRKYVIETWLTFFSSAGSFGAVVIALYLDPIRKLFSKPDLKLVVSNATPLSVIDNTDAGSSQKEEFIDICCRVENIGGSVAEKCRIVCEEVLTPGANKKFAASDENKFRPQTFSWIGQNDKKNECDISKSFYCYAKIAEVRTRNSELGKQEEVVSSKNGAIHYIVVCLPSRTVKNKYIQIDDEDSVIIPVSLCGDGVETRKRFVQITWKGKSIDDFRKHPEKLAVEDVTDDVKNLLG